MTSPWVFQPAPAPNVQPGPVTPAPDYFGQGANNLAQVLQALRQMSQTSQIENRRLDVQQEFDQGQISAKQAENQRLIDEQHYKETQAAETKRSLGMTGKALKQSFAARGITGLEGVPDENMVALVPDLEKSGYIGPLTDAERRLAAYKKYEPNLSPKVAKEFLGPQPGSVVNINPGETAYGKGQGEAESGVFKSALEGMPKLLQSMDFAIQGRQKAKSAITGFGAHAQLNVSRALSAFGRESSGNKATDTQLLQKLAQDRVLSLLASHSTGITRLTNQELQFLNSVSGGDITMQPEAIKKIQTINLGSDVRQAQGWIDELRQQAVDYPAYAGPALARAKTIEQKLQPRLKAYEGYVQEEAQQEQDAQRQQDAKDAQAVRQGLREK